MGQKPIGLRKLRLLSGKRCADAAKDVGVQTATYNSYELGSTEPSLGRMVALARSFEVSVMEVFLAACESCGISTEGVDICPPGK